MTWSSTTIVHLGQESGVTDRDLDIPVSPTLHKVLGGLHAQGHKALIVGGAVRDAMLGEKPKDIDVEVYGTDYDTLSKHLSQHGKVNVVGKAFGVVKFSDHEGNDYDFSLPRRDSKTGVGHKDFTTEFDPDITPKEAAARRDFTFNSLAYDPVEHKLHDYFGGEQDLKNKVIRHTSDAFAEDPLRVLRGMQFSARFGMDVHPDTAKLSQSIAHEYPTIPKERVSEEFMKLATKGKEPGRAIDYLQKTGWHKNFPELHSMYGVKQEREWHPEGDLETHTAHSMDAAAKIADREGLKGDDRATAVFGAMCHDMGKPSTTTTSDDGRIISHGHDQAGGPIAKKFLDDIGIKREISDKVKPLVENHMQHLNYESGISGRTVRRLAERLNPASIKELGYVMEADHSGRPPLPGGVPSGAQKMLDRASESNVTDHPMTKFIEGRDVMPYHDNVPGRHIGETVKAAYQAQLDGEINSREEGLEWLKKHYSQKTGHGKHITLYHGTNDAHWKDIQESGLKNPYLTQHKGLADYYAEAADGPGEPMVLGVDAHRRDLWVDHPSLEEPVGWGDIRSSDLEDRVRELFDRKRYISVQDSLDTVGTVHHEGVVPPDHITRISHRIVSTDPYRAYRAALREADEAGPEGHLASAARPGRHPADPRTRATARDYMASQDMPYDDSGEDEFVPVDEERGKRIAEAFEEAPHEPQHPAVVAAYQAFKDETLKQYDHLKAHGYEMTPWAGEGQPYKDSAEFTADVRNNRSIKYFKTVNPDEVSFGTESGGDPKDNPLLEDADRPATDTQGNVYHQTYNDLFRAVHDIYGHAKEGNQTGPRGEENAWRQHARMYSPLARRAMTTETRGQNSFVNFGTHLRRLDDSLPAKGDPDYVGLKDRPYADQKVALLPPEFSELHHAQQKAASWKDVRNKAVRLRNNNLVNLIQLGENIITSRVIGDHDIYDVSLWRQFPGSKSITTWDCDCEWGYWAFRRQHTYVGRMCSHALATLYAAQGKEKKSSVAAPCEECRRFGREGIEPLYHVSDSSNRASILEHGLHPAKSEVWQGREDYPWSWAFDDQQKALALAESHAERSGNPHSVDIWHIDPTGLKVTPDIHGPYFNSRTLHGTVPPNHLHVHSYDGSGEKLDFYHMFLSSTTIRAFAGLKPHDDHDIEDEKTLLRHMKRKHVDAGDEEMVDAVHEMHHDDRREFHQDDHAFFNENGWDDSIDDDEPKSPKTAEEYVKDVEPGEKREGDDFDYDTRWFKDGANHDVLDTVKHLSDAYPVTKGWFKGIRVSEKTPGMCVVPHDQRIWLSPRHLDPPGSPPTSGLNRDIAHEFGHVLHASVLQHEIGSQEIPDRTIDDLKASLKPKGPNLDHDLEHKDASPTWLQEEAKTRYPDAFISGYAETNQRERFAEAMTKHWVDPPATHDDQSRYIGEGIDFLYHRGSPAWKQRTSTKLYADDLRDLWDDHVSLSMRKEAGVDRDEWTHKGKPFSFGVVSLLDGQIEDTYRYKTAEDADFHHSHFVSQEHLGPIADREKDVFWLDNGEPRTMKGLPPGVRETIQSQIEPNKTASLKVATLRQSTLTIYASTGRPVKMSVEIADDPASIQTGLMNRPMLPMMSGMVFIPPYKPSYSGFWMQNVQFPISIAFWDRAGVIQEIIDMPVCSGNNCPTYRPKMPFWGAVEVNRGFFHQWGVLVGCKVVLG